MSAKEKTEKLTKSSSRSGSCRVGRPWCHHGKYRTHRFRVGSLEIVADLEWGAHTIRVLGVDGVIGADLASVQLSLVTLLQIEAQTHRACGLRFPKNRSSKSTLWNHIRQLDVMFPVRQKLLPAPGTASGKD
jgi:hypothetical protein